MLAVLPNLSYLLHYLISLIISIVTQATSQTFHGLHAHCTYRIHYVIRPSRGIVQRAILRCRIGP